MAVDIVTGQWKADGYQGKWRVRADGETYKGFYAYTKINRFKGIATGPLVFDANGNGRYDKYDFTIGGLKADLDIITNDIPPSASGFFSVDLDSDRLKLFYDGNLFGRGEIFQADRFFG